LSISSLSTAICIFFYAKKVPISFRFFYDPSFDYYNEEYVDYFFFLLIVVLICSLMLFICYLISSSKLYYEKLTGYECGFDPFSEARDPFDIKFYLISILFILFDIELLYFFP